MRYSAISLDREVRRSCLTRYNRVHNEKKTNKKDDEVKTDEH